MLLLSAVVILARTERPRLPDPGSLEDDFKTRYGKSIETFFEDRQKDRECREKLRKSKQKFLAHKKNAAFRLMDEERSERLVPLSQHCGDCIVDVEAPHLAGFSKWAKSDGICYHPVPDSEKSAAVKRGVGFLTNLHSYAQRQPTGFDYVLEFLGITPEGKHLPDLARVAQPPFFAFVAVKGIARFSLYHLIRNRFYDLVPGKEFVLEFHNIDEPQGFRPPTVVDKASGVQWLLALTGSQGFWYLSEKGISRYRTEADFSTLGMAFESDFALRVHVDTMLHFDDILHAPKAGNPS